MAPSCFAGFWGVAKTNGKGGDVGMVTQVDGMVRRVSQEMHRRSHSSDNLRPTKLEESEEKGSRSPIRQSEDFGGQVHFL
mmetsp:Transcript_88967/g.237278  ORF Transcript_88967/g.237278 Transcript_88967/m.237278 type:complete len:80 (-) Transcript_88967:11-250(-)|eukprot:CAMPEP_0113676730 /NCGR_PEP_ID=MMETSP0038_2-20120614/8824_1 /TAXON_ID=2898 /ORGANISM="Cryptomonas paramecium" /LENGTH=79 /DNA_ID=CAMNT_0000593829 /DNA_START=227 /DNA_END=466 /DNA_ORIENTATION=- /assembly_acc=CAM_ASM_000170